MPFDFDGFTSAPPVRHVHLVDQVTHDLLPVVATDDGLDQAVERVVYGRVTAWPVRSPVGGLVAGIHQQRENVGPFGVLPASRGAGAVGRMAGL